MPDRQERESINPLARFRGRPDQNQIVHDQPRRKVLRNHEESQTALRPHELQEVSRHRRLVVRHEYAALACGTRQGFWVSEAGQPAAVAILKLMAGARLSTAETMI